MVQAFTYGELDSVISDDFSEFVAWLAYLMRWYDVRSCEGEFVRVKSSHVTVTQLAPVPLSL